MQIPEAKLEEFMTLYERRYGVHLSKKDALERALRLLGFMRTVFEVKT